MLSLLRRVKRRFVPSPPGGVEESELPKGEPAGPGLPPFPPLEYRQTVGPTDKALFDNPTGERIWGDLAIGPLAPGEAYRRVFDFGCGCGRNARQLLLQDEPPERYVGVDVHAGMVRWCQEYLGEPEYKEGVKLSFHHHDVWNATYAPRNSRNETLPLHPYGTDFTLVNAHSVFTHLLERQTEKDLAECRRLITDRGLLRTTWFFFNREWFPVLAEHQHTLLVNDHDPTQAVYYDWTYFCDLLRRNSLKLVAVNWTRKPGYQTEAFLARGDGFDDLLDSDLEPPDTVLGFGGSEPPPFDGPF